MELYIPALWGASHRYHYRCWLYQHDANRVHMPGAISRLGGWMTHVYQYPRLASNWRPLDYRSQVLPTELLGCHMKGKKNFDAHLVFGRDVIDIHY